MYEQLTSVKTNLAHAYVCTGDIDSNVVAIGKFITEQLSISIVGNPNIYNSTFSSMTIADARILTEQQSKTAVGNSKKKIFIISFTTITREAQNALLKTLEEPTEDTLIFLLTGSVDNLLSTILSRCQVLSGQSVDSYSDLVLEYLASDFVGREKIYKQFLGDSKKNIPVNKSGAARFISEILSLVLKQKKLADMTNVYRDIEEMKTFITDRSSSVKYIFEYISIRLPIIE